MKTEIVGKEGNPLCVLGAVDSVIGRAIEREMIEWLIESYRVHIVWHDGSTYEYAALSYMQALCIKTGKPCLYLHTKGAYNKPMRSYSIRQMWRHEFGYRRDVYQNLVNIQFPTVVCQFTGADRLTRYNGFIANKAAMEAIPTIMPSENRFIYEQLFRDHEEVNIIGSIYYDIETSNIRKAHEYLQKYY